MTQTPRQQTEEILTDIWYGAIGKSVREVSEAADAILAVFKGLPAMQKKDASWQETWKDGKRHKIDNPEITIENNLRRRILAELEGE